MHKFVPFLEVYPRMCGVGKFVPFWIARAWVYPRMCGVGRDDSFSRVLLKVYPRVCGVGRDDPFSRVLLKVYPRVCGVGPYPDMIPPSEYGLSPHVRGRLDQASPVPALFGGIPACTG